MRAPLSGRLEHAEPVAQPGELFLSYSNLVKHLPSGCLDDNERL